MKLAELKQDHGVFRVYLFALIALGISFYLGYVTGNWYHVERETELLRLQHTLDNLLAENDKFNRQLNVLNVELEVARLANREAQQSLEDSLAERIEMQNMLGFYQRVMAPEQTQQGFVIEAFDIQPALSQNHYRYTLALTQQHRSKAVVKGNIRVTVSGNQQGQVTEYALTALSQPKDSKPLTFSFRYFQTLEGILVLPDGFEPEKIRVDAEIFQFKKKRGDLSQTFDWQS